MHVKCLGGFFNPQNLGKKFLVWECTIVEFSKVTVSSRTTCIVDRLGQTMLVSSLCNHSL